MATSITRSLNGLSGLDEQRTRLAELLNAYTAERPSALGPLAKDITEQRDALAAEMGRHATTVGATIREPRALALLLDVLVGITNGTLDHNPEFWHVEHRDRADAPWQVTRCLAGWLVHTAHRYAEPVLDVYDVNKRTARAVLLHPGGEQISYDELAATVLGVEVYEMVGRTDLPFRLVTHRVHALFGACNTLADLWHLAHLYTGGAITIPADLAPRVGAHEVVW
jgi:hypothetical protein